MFDNNTFILLMILVIVCAAVICFLLKSFEKSLKPRKPKTEAKDLHSNKQGEGHYSDDKQDEFVTPKKTQNSTRMAQLKKTKQSAEKERNRFYEKDSEPSSSKEGYYGDDEDEFMEPKKTQSFTRMAELKSLNTLNR